MTTDNTDKTPDSNRLTQVDDKARKRCVRGAPVPCLAPKFGGQHVPPEVWQNCHPKRGRTVKMTTDKLNKTGKSMLKNMSIAILLAITILLAFTAVAMATASWS